MNQFFFFTDDEPRSHFIRPENYQVTWWPGDRPEDEINSDSTSGIHLNQGKFWD